MNYYNLIPLTGRIFNIYTYKYPEKIYLGQRAIIDFNGKQVIGLVFEENLENNLKDKNIKNIDFIIDKKPILNKYHLELIRKTSEFFLIPLSDTAKLLFPPISTDMYKLLLVPNNELAPFQKKIYLNDFYKMYDDKKKAKERLKELLNNNIVHLTLTTSKFLKEKPKFIDLKISNEKIWDLKLSSSAINVVNFLNINGKTELKNLYEENIVSKQSSVIKTLLKKGVIKIFDSENICYYPKKLSCDQLKSISIFKNSNKKKYFLYGVTGSGKTEVFFNIAEEHLINNKKVIILVPEISLTPQTVNRIKERFPNYIVEMFHSGLSNSKKTKNWYACTKGEIDVIVGTRSAIWLPMKDLSLIIIDEEHDSSYYQTEKVNYDTISVAEMRSDIEGINILLSSATPRVFDYKKVNDNIYELALLKERYFSKMPEIEIIDMKKEKKYNWIFSHTVIKQIKKTLSEDKKIIIFTPTRGYANYIMCSDCGYIFKCENCDVSMTYHKNDSKLSCHYCGLEKKIPDKCPICKSYNLQSRGYGTEKVVSDIMKIFPSEEVVRIDRTVIKNYEELKKTFNYIKEPGKKIIVGTKMITKGLDIEDLQLVIILDFERYSNFPDYTSFETASSLLIQVAGRSGRREIGKVLVQSFKLEKNSYEYLINHDYNKIIDKELNERKEFGYPPFNEMYLFIISNEDIKIVEETSNSLINDLKNTFTNSKILGPTTPLISKLKGNYRKQILFLPKIIDKNLLFPIIKKYDKLLYLYVNPPTTIL